MIHDETKRKLRELNIDELVTYLESQISEISYSGMTFDERFQMMVDHLYQEKYNGKVQRILKLSKLRLPKADINDIHYIQRGINRQIVLELGTCQFIDSHANVIFHGFTGSGKTYLACALRKQACKRQLRTRYIRVPDLLMEYVNPLLFQKGHKSCLRSTAVLHCLFLMSGFLRKYRMKSSTFSSS